MIRVAVFKDSHGIYKGFKSLGHAGYGEYSQDIVCSAVSALVLNTVNSIEAFTKDSMKVKADEEKGLIQVYFPSPVGQKTKLLMDALVLGLKMIQKEYKNDYIHLKIKEV